MTVKEAIRELEYDKELYTTDAQGKPLDPELLEGTPDGVLADALDMAIEALQKLRTSSMERSSQYYNGGWIPLDDYGPPAKNGIYEVTAYWHETWQTLQAEYIDGHWFVITRMGVLKDIPVEAWRYVAEPYQSKKKGENDE